MTTYEPADWYPKTGELALVTHQGGETDTRFAAIGSHGSYWRSHIGAWAWPFSEVTNARRLQVVDPASVVTLDPNNPDDLEALAGPFKVHTSTVADVLRCLLPTPPLPEPNGLGARVIDGDGLLDARQARARRHRPLEHMGAPDWPADHRPRLLLWRPRMPRRCGRCPDRGDTMTELSSEIRNALYVACGFARNRNVETVVETFLAAARAEVARDMRAKIEALADDFHDRSQSHAWPTPSSMAYRDAWQTASTALRALLADGGEPQ